MTYFVYQVIEIMLKEATNIGEDGATIHHQQGKLIFLFDFGAFRCPYQYKERIIGDVPKDTISRLTWEEK